MSNLGKKMDGFEDINRNASYGLCKFACALSICKMYANHSCNCKDVQGKYRKGSSFNGKYDSLLLSKKEYNFS